MENGLDLVLIQLTKPIYFNTKAMRADAMRADAY